MFARHFSLIAVFLLLTVSGRAQELSVEKVEGQANFMIEDASVTDLSGLTWTGGDSFYVVADHPNLLVPVTLKIDRGTGCISQGTISPSIPVQASVSDFEGVTYVSATKTFFISAETGNAVISFRPGGEAQLQPVPKIFSQARRNLSLESITWNDTAAHFWIANEEALEPDGPVSGIEGTLVRLQQLDARFRPVAQFAWRTEPAAFRFRDSGNGVSDLCLLPDGRLLVLERGFALGGLQTRIFLADFKGATDTAQLPALAGAEFVPAKKTLIFQQPTGFINFEGIALGPILDDGSRSLILIADSNGGRGHNFLALKLRLNSPVTSREPGVKAPEAKRADAGPGKR